jgi:hypothetical protein
MLIEKDTIKAESHFNEERTHRYLCQRIWDKSKPPIAVIMLNPCTSDNIINDTTTMLTINAVARLEEYGGVHILNLYSMLTNKLSFRYNSDEDLSHKENDDYILRSAAECSKIVLAWGHTEATNMRIADRVVKVINLLMPYADKLCCISDGENNFYHPLCPKVRNDWILEHVDIKKWLKDDESKSVPT